MCETAKGPIFHFESRWPLRKIYWANAQKKGCKLERKKRPMRKRQKSSEFKDEELLTKYEYEKGREKVDGSKEERPQAGC